MLKFAALALALARQDLQDRFAGSALGTTWLFIWPLVQLFIYIVIFGKLMGARLGMDNHAFSYGFYIAAGLLSWTYFAGSLTLCARSFIDRRHIIRKVNVELAVFPAAACLSEMLPFGAGLILLVCADLAAGWQPAPFWCAMLIPAFYCQTILAFGFGLFLACAAVFARDVAEATAICLQMAFWFTPIVYLPGILPDWLAGILWLNPMCAITGIFQNCFILNAAPDWFAICYAALVSHIALGLGLFTLACMRKDVRDVL